MLSAGELTISLNSRGRAGAFLIIAGVPALLLAGEIIRLAIAETLGESESVLHLREAIALDPSNAKYYQRLGLIHSYSPEDLDPSNSLHCLRRATELNPNNAVYWADLGSACDWVLDTACADRAFERALSLSPSTPRLHWLAANHYLRTRRSGTALAHFENLLELSPQYAGPTFEVALGVLGDPQIIFEKVLSPNGNPVVKLDFLHFLSAHGQADFAYGVWRQLAASHKKFPFALVEPYVQRLIELGRSEEVSRVWQDLEQLRVIQKPPDASTENLVFNGDFEQAPLNTGLDWRSAALPYLFVDFSDASAFRGSRSARFDFTVKRNDESEPVYQIVPVRPNQEYQFQAFVRSDGITSDSGPRLRLRDSACASCLDIWTETTVGTTRWHPVSVRFKTGPETHLLRVSVWRSRSRSFPTDISGRFWLDAVSLTAVGEAGEKTNLGSGNVR